MKSEIGAIVFKLFLDKYSRNPFHRLDSKTRMRLQKEKAILINCTHKCKIELNGEINSNVSIPARFEEEFNLNEDLSDYWLIWLQRTFRKLYE